MKKILLLLLMSLFIGINTVQAESSVAQETNNLLNSLKDAIVNDISNTVNSTVNNAKLTKYKNKLEEKKEELKKLQDSSTFFLIKTFKRIKLNQDISELEVKIAELEAQK